LVKKIVTLLNPGIWLEN